MSDMYLEVERYTWENCTLRCCPCPPRPPSSAAEGIKLVGTVTAVTTGGRGLKARVRTEPHVRSGEPAKCLQKEKQARRSMMANNIYSKKE